MVVALKTGMRSKRRKELDTDNLSPHRLSSGWAACKTRETTTPLVTRPTEPRALRWGIVLAGGDGTRLQSLVKLICGEERPKQFCPLFGAVRCWLRRSGERN